MSLDDWRQIACPSGLAEKEIPRAGKPHAG